MKKYISILIFLIAAVLLHGAVPRETAVQDAEMQTASGIAVVYRVGTAQMPGGLQLLRELDREVTRLFRAPPGVGSCKIIIDRAFTESIAFKSRGKVREILLPESFPEKSSDLQFRGQLTGEILGGRYALQGPLRPLPGWIVYGLEGIRQNAQSAGRIVRNQQYYPVLRGMMGIDCMPDFRALMQLEDCEFSGSAGAAVCEFGRFLLETYAAVSSVRQNALGDYAAEMLKGERREPDVYRTTLLPVMTSGRHRDLSETDFFKLYATRAAFNYRSPRPAVALLERLPEVLKFEVHSAAEPRKVWKGDVMQLPAMLAEKKPEALLAQQQIRLKLQRFFTEFPPEIMSAGGSFLQAVSSMSGRSPEAECAALQNGRLELEKQLKNWMKVEKYLEECEQKYVRPGVLFRPELSTVSGDGEFLTPAGIEFFDQVEKKYLEH